MKTVSEVFNMTLVEAAQHIQTWADEKGITPGEWLIDYYNNPRPQRSEEYRAFSVFTDPGDRLHSFGHNRSRIQQLARDLKSIQDTSNTEGNSIYNDLKAKGLF